MEEIEKQEKEALLSLDMGAIAKGDLAIMLSDKDVIPEALHENFTNTTTEVDVEATTAKIEAQLKEAKFEGTIEDYNRKKQEQQFSKFRNERFRGGKFGNDSALSNGRFRSGRPNEVEPIVSEVVSEEILPEIDITPITKEVKTLDLQKFYFGYADALKGKMIEMQAEIDLLKSK